MGLTHVIVTLKNLGPPSGAYEADFLVDAGATASLVPAAELRKIGAQPVGTMVYELADGTIHEYAFGFRMERQRQGGRRLRRPLFNCWSRSDSALPTHASSALPWGPCSAQ